MPIFDKIDVASFFRFIVAAFIVFGVFQLLVFSAREYERRTEAEVIVNPTPLPCDQPYIWQDEDSGEVVLSCTPILSLPSQPTTNQ